jgi:hypothetical protein
MNSNREAVGTGYISPLIYARVAGLAYVVIIMIGIFSVSYIDSKILVPDNDAATVDNIINNELRFRISIVSEIIMYTLVVLLSHALYVILKNVNRDIALLAMLWRIGEAIIGAGVAVLTGFIPLLLINGEAAFEQDQLQAMVGLFLQLRNAGLDVVLIFIGMGGTVFCYLFFVSKYIPRILAVWGMLTYLSMLILALVSILSPSLPESVKMIFYIPGGLFEIIIGLWLLVKGIKVNRETLYA